jgi:ubiquinol-cytochrome c reductase iron-sulfur subunit
MTTETVNTGRRTFLIGATSVVGAAGAVGIAVPFVASWNPSAKAKSAGAPVIFNKSKIEPGAMVTVEWRRQPIYVVRRTQESLDLLKTIPKSDLKDADSENLAQQPEYARNETRASDPEFLVLKAVCTHLGCAPKYRPELGGDLGADWMGGFFCPCHGSRFDLAGRVYAGAPAGANLPIPPHRFDGDVLVIGEDGGDA